MPDTYLITGAGRGIGRGLAESLAADGNTVIAAMRNLSSAGDLATTCRIEQLDVTDPASARQLADRLAGVTMDVVINMAAVFPTMPGIAEGFDHSAYMHTMLTNAAGPLLVTHALLPNLELGNRKTIVNVTSNLGSVALNSNPGWFSYCGSKAALNTNTRSLAHELGPMGFCCVMLHPGWVRTDLGGPNGEISLEECISRLTPLVEQLTGDDNGRFIDNLGTDMPW